MPKLSELLEPKCPACETLERAADRSQPIGSFVVDNLDYGYIVVGNFPQSKVSVVHSTYEEAKEEAKRLSKSRWKTKFFVCRIETWLEVVTEPPEPKVRDLTK